MAQNTTRQSERVVRRRRKMKRWQKVVSSLACVVVFCTTYALILPAITMEQKAYCGYAEHTSHSVEDGCYKEMESLICKKAEGDGHTHSDGCYQTTQSLVCGKEEFSGHSHSSDCYTVREVLTCKQEENEEHTHDSGCYTQEKELTCGKEESSGHSHSSDCYKNETSLICGQEEQKAHKHGKECYETTRKLTCEKELHTHTLACFSNSKADVEKQSEWEKTMAKVKLTGHWDEDVLAIAETQLGYSESEKNYIVNEDGKKKGYTRYGAWYGDSYGDWCAMFVSFCLNYADVDRKVMPIEANCQRWIEKLADEDFQLYRRAEGYTPKPGDLVFFDWDDFEKEENRHCDHVGLVSKLIYDKEKPEKLVRIQTIEGNSSDKVQYKEYEINDTVIMGYGELPENPNPPAEDEDAQDDGESDPADQSGETSEETEGETSAESSEEAENPEEVELPAIEEPVEELPEEEEDEGLPRTELTYEGSDYTISISYTERAEIPEEAELSVREIEQGSSEFEECLQKSEEALGIDGVEDENGLIQTITFARYFDITFLVDGEKIEPAAPVKVSISYQDSVEIPESDSAGVIHFAEDGTELIVVQTSQSEETKTDSETAVDTFEFLQDSFSITGTYVASTSLADGQYILYSWYNGNNGAYYALAKDGTAKKVTVDQGLVTYDGDAADITWTLSTNGNNRYLRNSDGRYLSMSGTNVANTTTQTATAMLAIPNDPGAFQIHQGDNYTVLTNTTRFTTSTQYASYVYFANDIQDSSSSGGSTIAGAPAAGTVSGVQTTKLVEGEWYILYGYSNATSNNNYSGGRAINARNINSTEALSQVSTNGGTVTYTGTEDVLWQWTGNGFRNRNGEYLRLDYDYSSSSTSFYKSTSTTSAQMDRNVLYSSNYRTLYNQDSYTRRVLLGTRTYTVYNKVYVPATRTGAYGITESAQGTISYDNYGTAVPIYIAQVTGLASTTTGHANHPQTAVTGKPEDDDLTFYNFDATTGGVDGLAGVEYTIYDADTMDEVAVYRTTDDFATVVKGLDRGHTYKIRQTAVPPGYVVVTQEREFNVSNEGTAVIGVFYDYKASDYDVDKTAQVVDYINRTYQIDLKVMQELYDYRIENIDYTLVVDQSNSMLFPTELTDTGKKVTLYLDSKRTNNDGQGDQRNVINMNNLNLDKNQVYYIIADESVTSTVYAVFWDGSGWVFQDASFYAKAQNNAYGETHNLTNNGTKPPYAQSGVAYNTGVNANSNGGDIGLSFTGQNNATKIHEDIVNAGGTSKSFTLYTGSYYNRLHDLQHGVAMLVNALSSMSENSRVRLETFDRYVETCQMWNLGTDGSGIANVIEGVNSIECSGGTRQDRALDHLRGVNESGANNTGHTTNHLSAANTGGRKQYVMLITDGAPVKSGNDSAVTMDTVRTAATNVKNAGATLITAGLSMGNVQGGSQMLIDAASNKPGGGKWNYATESTQQVLDAIVDILFNIAEKEYHDVDAKVVDEISDSFYPINPATNQALTSGTMVDLNGNVITSKPSNGQYGTVRYNSSTDTWYVEWADQTVSSSSNDTPDSSYIEYTYTDGNGKTTVLDTSKTYYISNYNSTQTISTSSTSYTLRYINGSWVYRYNNRSYSVGNRVSSRNVTVPGTSSAWNGRIYVKAKEDFVGGNTIDTNKKADVTLTYEVAHQERIIAYSELETPTVNVRLLPINSVSSEETVFLGDDVEAVNDKLQALWDQLKFTKLVDNGDDVHNKYNADADDDGLEENDGLGDKTFTLSYAMDAPHLTTEDWTKLKNGESITVPYIYDDASSHGDVGYFTISLEKDSKPGETASYSDHKTTLSGEDVETYTLTVNYTAYRITGGGDLDTREDNVHNGSRGPGTEVGTPGMTTLETGKGTITSENVHIVNVVDGAVKVGKLLDSSLVSTTEDQTFTFILHKKDEETGQYQPVPKLDASGKPITDEEGNPVSVTLDVTVAANQHEGTNKLENLPRGEYMLVERESLEYRVDEIGSVETETNCFHKDEPDVQAIYFTLGSDENGTDVIEHLTVTWTDRDGNPTSGVYSDLRDGFYGTDANGQPDYIYGVSHESALIGNTVAEHKAEIHVKKSWNQVDYSEYKDLDVYAALYKNGAPVKDDEDHLLTVHLNRANNWKGSFEIVLPARDSDISELGYSIRELDGVVSQQTGSAEFAAVILNEKTADNTYPVVWYETAAPSGIIHIGDRGYDVSVDDGEVVTTDDGEEFTITVTNSKAYALPETGGIGTLPFTIGGTLMMSASLLYYGLSLRRKRERRMK